MFDELYTCPVCQAQFSTAHTDDWTHCELCGMHGRHACPVRAARKERAREFLRERPKHGQPWTSKRYNYSDE